MTTETKQTKKYDPFKIALGALYRGYLESDKAEKYVITNIHAREWKGILNYFKKQQYIVDFKLGDTIETACDIGVVGFDIDKVTRQDLVNYCQGVVNKMKSEAEEVTEVVETEEE